MSHFSEVMLILKYKPNPRRINDIRPLAGLVSWVLSAASLSHAREYPVRAKEIPHPPSAKFAGECVDTPLTARAFFYRDKLIN